MNKVMKTWSAIMLMVVVLCAACTKDTENGGGNNNGGNGSGNSSGGGGGNANSHEYVDLGLPSGTLWATCNVGANAPEEYGDYFAWGETSPKDYYDWSTYKWCNGSPDQMTKYCNNSDFGYNGFTDNLTILESGDDAATVNWGSGWHTPTKGQWQELEDNTTSEWTTRNDVYGQVFYGNGQSLFLPAAGCRAGNSLSFVGKTGDYWSSSLSYPLYVRGFFLNSGDYYMAYTSREYGRSVRPVRSAR